MKAQIVSFHCVLKDNLGKIISSTFNNDVLTGSIPGEQKLLGLSKALQNLREGERRRVSLKAHEAYGYYDPELVITVPRKNIMQIDGMKQGHDSVVLFFNGKNRVFRVIHQSGNMMTLDANHPLAGQDLVFEIEALSVRDATPEEISGSDLDNSGPLLH